MEEPTKITDILTLYCLVKLGLLNFVVQIEVQVKKCFNLVWVSISFVSFP